MKRPRKWVGSALFCALVACGGVSKESHEGDDSESMGGAEPIQGRGDGSDSSGGEGSAEVGGKTSDDDGAGDASGGALDAGGASAGSDGGGGKLSGNSGGGATDSGGSENTGGGTEGLGAGGTSGSPCGTEGEDGELCEWGCFDTDLSDDGLTCARWTVCQPGEYVEESGFYTRDSECQPCAEGTFTSVSDASFCNSWHICEFGEQVDKAPTDTQNRTCEPSEQFSLQAGRAVDFVISDLGPQLLVYEENSPSPRESVVYSYSHTGDSLGQMTASTGVASGESDSIDNARRVVSVGDDVFVLAQGAASPGPASVRKFSESGALEWETPLGADADGHSELNIAAGRDAIYVVANAHEGSSASAGPQLYVLDAEDGTLTSPALEGDPVGSPQAMAVATNGHLFIAGLISPESSERDYQNLMEYEPDGTLVMEQQLPFDSISYLAARESGGVYAYLPDYPHFWHFVYQADSEGEAEIVAGFDHDVIFEFVALATTGSDMWVLAWGSGSDAIFLVTIDLDTGLHSIEEVVRPLPEEFIGMQVAPDGRLLVAGTRMTEEGDLLAFVAPLLQ